MEQTDIARLGGHLEAVAGVRISEPILSELLDLDPQFAAFMDRLDRQAKRVNRTPAAAESPVERAQRVLTELEAQGYGEKTVKRRRPRSKKRRRR